MDKMSTKRKYLLSTLLAVSFGYFAGAYSIRGLSVSEIERLGKLSYAIYNQDVFNTDFLTAFYNNSLFIIIILFAGLSVIGFLAVLPLIFYKSYGFGFSSAVFYLVFGAKGIIPVITLLLPTAFIIYILLIFSGADALCFSLNVLNGEDKHNSMLRLRDYLFKTVIYSVISLVVPFFDIVIYPFFVHLFRWAIL
ncbi:MAG: hypothetical protein K0S55_1985 [Clostridia bacterium]|jgi:hypothetical protein|nr:hypothetical protein [Clostridia bacterium]